MKIKKEVKVGAFAIAGIIILIFGYNFLKGFNPLKGYNKYYVVYHNVSGIVKSTQVNINGLKVGQVEDIGMLRPGDASRILVTLIVVDNIRLSKGTTAAITSQDLLGTKVIDILPDSVSSIYLANGDTLVGAGEESLTTSISNMVSPLKEKSEQVLATLDQVLQSMNDVFDSSGTRRIASGINDISWSIHSLRNMTDRFDQLTRVEYDKITSMVESLESITRNLKNSNESIAKALKNIAHISDSIAAADLTSTINNTNLVMHEFAIALNKINRGEGSLGKLANDSALYVNLNKTSTELGALLRDMQDYPARYFTVSVFGGGSRAAKADKKRQEQKKK